MSSGSNTVEPQTPRLTELNPHVLLSPPLGTHRPNAADPSIILLFGWMDAKLPHLQKYVDPLRSAFQTSTIVVIKASTSFYFTSQTQLETLLIPAVDIIRKEMSERPVFRGVLVHVLSNGGGFQLMTLRKVLAKLPATPNGSSVKATPVALILDSVPGDDGLSSSISSMALANPILHLLSIAPIAFIYAIYSAVNSLGGHPPIFDELRSTLNAPILLPSVQDSGSPAAVPRLYIYSDSDKIIAASKVAAHLEVAVSKGYDVTVEKFQNTAHVSHARSDPDRYWSAVNRLWVKAVAASLSPVVSSSL